MSKLQPYGYYYGDEADQYTFYRLPKALFTERYRDLSDGAKILYGLMLDRMGLSIKNGWIDERSRVYIIFTLEDAQAHMNCSHDKGVKLFAELDMEKGVGLIERIKQGQGKPAIIYVRKFFDVAEALTSEKPKSGLPGQPKSRLQKNRSLDFGRTEGNNTEISNTDLSQTELNHSYPLLRERAGGTPKSGTDMDNDTLTHFRTIINENIDYLRMSERFGQGRIDELTSLILESVCTARKTIRIASDEYPSEFVREKLLQLTGAHIEYVMDCLSQNTGEIRNIKQYLLAALFNAPSTIDNHFAVETVHRKKRASATSKAEANANWTALFNT